MKSNYIYVLILILNTYFTLIKSEESIYSSIDIDFNGIDDNILNSFNDFEFVKDKQDTLSIKQKMKKVACLNIITAVLKESRGDIKKQLRAAKEVNKNNFNKFINNMTETCINIITEKHINQIFNHNNYENRKFPLGKNEIKFKEHMAQFLEENEKFKKMEELELERQKRNKMIFNSIIIGVVVLVILIFFNVFRKKKSNDKDVNKEKSEKKTGHKKKGKKN